MNKLLLGVIICGLFLSSCNKKLGSIFSNRNKLEILNPEFDYLVSKAKFKFDDDGKKISANANFRIKKDSVIWVSISSFGIEGARVLIDRQNLKAIDKLNKNYYEYSFDELSQKYNFDFNYDMVQSVLLGNQIAPYKNQKYELVNEQYVYQELLRNYNFENYIGSISRKLEKVYVTDEITKNSISVNYQDFREIDNQVFPNKVKATISYDSPNEPDTKINIEYNKMELQTSPLKFPFSVSEKYEKK